VNVIAVIPVHANLNAGALPLLSLYCRIIMPGRMNGLKPQKSWEVSPSYLIDSILSPCCLSNRCLQPLPQCHVPTAHGPHHGHASECPDLALRSRPYIVCRSNIGAAGGTRWGNSCGCLVVISEMLLLQAITDGPYLLRSQPQSL
jgi:hypothetical protein